MARKWDREQTYGGYYYIDENGNKSEVFYRAEDYCEGFALVVRRGENVWRYRDENGNVSKEGFGWSFDYHEGFAVVCKIEDGRWYFRDKNGNVSKEGFISASGYSEGLAAVQKKDGCWYFRDKNGNVSKEGFYNVSILGYRDGACQVQKSWDCGDQYRDICGNLYYSEKEAKASSQKIKAEREKAKEEAKESTKIKNDENLNNSVQVKDGDNTNKACQTKINDDASKSTSAKGETYAKIEDYLKNKVSVYALSPEDIYTHRNKIISFEKHKFELKQKVDDIEIWVETLKDTSEILGYIKQTADKYSSEDLKNKELKEKEQREKEVREKELREKALREKELLEIEDDIDELF